jgi:hypothetical protein
MLATLPRPLFGKKAWPIFASAEEKNGNSSPLKIIEGVECGANELFCFNIFGAREACPFLQSV